MKRVLAIVGAALMISVAIFIRSARESDDDNGGSAGTGNSSTITIACVTELAAQCRTLESDSVHVSVEDAADTAEKLQKGEADIDGWLTLGPWPAIANELAQRQVVDEGTPVASTGLIMALVKERAEVLARSCPDGQVTWRCLVDATGKPWTDLGGDEGWGTVKLGLPEVSSAFGLLLNGNAVAGYFKNADIATNEFDADPAFREWQSKLNRASNDNQAVTKFAQQFPAAFSAVGASTADASLRGRLATDVQNVPGVPPANAVAVLAPVTGSRNARKVDDLATSQALENSFSDAGWSVEAQPDSGLPSAGVLLALSGLGR